MTVSSYTPNFKLALIDFNSQNWHGDEWSNLLLIDAILKANFANVQFANAAGTNTITAAYTPALVYASGLTVLFKLASTPTGASTFNGYPLKIAGADIQGGVLQAGDVVRALFDGTNFNVIEPVRIFSSLTVRSGSSGATPISTANNMLLDLNASGGFSILSPSNSVAALIFGRPTKTNAGGLAFNHNTDELHIGGAKIVVDSDAYFLTGASVIGSVTAGGGFYGVLHGDVTGNAGNVTGVIAVDHGGTGATNVSGIKSLLGLGSLAYLGAVNGSNWSGADLAVGDGGTGASTPSVALANLGGAPNSRFVVQTQAGASYTGFTDGMFSFEY